MFPTRISFALAMTTPLVVAGSATAGTTPDQHQVHELGVLLEEKGVDMK